MLKIGHRGASAHAPENTLTAFRQALALGADGVELDVHRCKSGELVVIHDDTVERTTDGAGLVAEMTLAELRTLHISEKEHIPTLDEVLDTLAGAYCFVEVKHADTAIQAARQIQSRVDQGWPNERLWLISFEHKALAEVIRAFPLLYVGYSFEQLTESSMIQASAAGTRAIIPHHKAFTQTQVTEAHALNLQVISWTANDSLDISRLQALGVDGIMSDYPERL